MESILSAPRVSLGVLSILRIYTGLSLLQHGTGKILGFPAAPAFANVQINTLAGAGGLIELIGGILFTIGLFTRPVAFILAGFTAVRLFHGACRTKFLSGAEPRRARRGLLLRLPLFRLRGRGGMEPRCPERRQDGLTAGFSAMHAGLRAFTSPTTLRGSSGTTAAPE